MNIQLETRETIVREFVITDNNKVEHKAVIAGVLDICKYTERQQSNSVQTIKDVFIHTIKSWEEKCISKQLSIGLSITNPTDTYSVDKGTLIAEGRAVKPSKQIMCLSTESKGALGREMVATILDQQVDFIKRNPSLFLKVTPVATEEVAL